MGSLPTVLLDCDGVIVDNRRFEERVTDIVVDTLANNIEISRSEAKAMWDHELRETKGSPFWYDYAYHCDRLGLNGDFVVENAHQRARDLLCSVSGAEETLALLKQYGFTVGVVTDATSWVVRFKLKSLGIDQPSIVFSSSDAGATKASPIYWDTLAKMKPDLQPATFVDNRQVNLVSAQNTFPELSLVRFNMDEHVTTLSQSIAPRSEVAITTAVVTVHDHLQLRSWFLSSLPELVR